MYQWSESIIEGDDDHVLLSGEASAINPARTPRTRAETTPMNVHHHRQVGAGGGTAALSRRSKDVHKEAVLAGRGRLGRRVLARVAVPLPCALVARRAVACRVAQRWPPAVRPQLCRRETARTERWQGVGQAEEGLCGATRQPKDHS